MAEITDIQKNTFIDSAKKFLNHKLILSDKSSWMKAPEKKHHMQRARLIFGEFLATPKSYPVGQLALLIKRNEELLINICPFPNTPAYESSLRLAAELGDTASKIIDALNLQDIL